jgi:hypothetical protein
VLVRSVSSFFLEPPPMALDTLSPDSLTEILQYLDGIAVIRLLQCGRSHLSAKIGQIKKLRIEGRPFMKFPFFVFQLPQLQSLSIHRPSHGYLYPLRLYGAVPLPTTPVNSITKLSFAFSQSFSVLRLETDGVPLLGRITPNLKSLHLQRSTTPLELRHMQAVPKGLTKLHLSARYMELSSTFMLRKCNESSTWTKVSSPVFCHQTRRNDKRLHTHCLANWIDVS